MGRTTYCEILSDQNRLRIKCMYSPINVALVITGYNTGIFGNWDVLWRKKLTGSNVFLPSLDNDA